jgi:cell division inhibitor SepF
MKVLKNIKQVFGLEEAEEEGKVEGVEVEEKVEEEVVASKEEKLEEEGFSVPIYSENTPQNNVYKSQENIGDYQTIFVNPTNFEECKKIANYINKEKIVTINLEGLTTEAAQRLLDFLSGAMEVKKARFVTVSKKVYMSIPDGIKSYIEEENGNEIFG